MPVSQEVHFAHHLAANEKVTRDRALRKLTRWIRAKSGRQGMEFSEEALMKLWKGLFFCMWMSDKPFVQQELANNIAGLVHCFAKRDQALMFLDAFFKTMAREWFAIDRFRLEKFMMLVRRCFRQGVAFSYGDAWSDENITSFCDMLQTTALLPNGQEIPLGLRMHVVDVFLQELARTHGGELTPEQAMLFLQPFFNILMQSNDRTLLDAVRKNVFFLLLDLDREAAELGVDPSTVKIKGSNGTTEDGDSAEEEEEDMYDEHGRVLEKGESCQDLPAIPFDYSMIADKLFDMLKETTLKPFNRGLITRMVKKFRAVLQEGLVRPRVEETVEDPITEEEIEAAANKLEEELEEELKEDRVEVDKLKQERGKGKPKFGFDSTSGAYEYIFNSDGDSEEDEGLKRRTAQNKKRPRRKVRQADSDEDADPSCDSDEPEGDMPSTKNTSNKRKRGAGLPRNHQKVTSADCPKEDESTPPKKKRRRQRRKKPLGSLAGIADETVEGMMSSNSLNTDTKPTEGELKCSTPAGKAVVVAGGKKISSTSKKPNRLLQENTPQERVLSAKQEAGSVGDIAQQEGSKPLKNGDSSAKGAASASPKDQQQKKLGKAHMRRQARKEKKERRLSALSKGFHVAPLSAKSGEANELDVAAMPTSVLNQTGKAVESTESPRLPLLHGEDVGSMSVNQHTVARTERLPSTPLKRLCKVSGDGAKVQNEAQPTSPIHSNRAGSTGPGSPVKTGVRLPKPPVLTPNNLKAVKSPRSPVEKKTEAARRRVSKELTSTLLASPSDDDKGSSGNTSTTKLPCTPKANSSVAPALRKCFTETKAKKAKLTKFSTPPAKLSTPSEEKKVIFALSKNKAQDPREYFETLKNSPKIPFDASKKPAQGVLKARQSLPSDTPAPSSTKKRVRASDVFRPDTNRVLPKKRSSASDFF